MATEGNGGAALAGPPPLPASSPGHPGQLHEDDSFNVVAEALRYAKQSDAVENDEASANGETLDPNAFSSQKAAEAPEFPFGRANGTAGLPPTNSLAKIASKLLASTHGANADSELGPPVENTATKQDAEGSGAGTPTRRRSVQFARGVQDAEERAQANRFAAAVEGESPAETPGQSRTAKLKSKLLSIAAPSFTPNAGRSDSGQFGGDSAMSEDMDGNSSPWVERSFLHRRTRSDAGAEDADAEQSNDEPDSPGFFRTLQRDKRRKQRYNLHRSAPTTPAALETDTEYFQATRPHVTARRATYATIESNRQGYSEDEGRERLESIKSQKRRASAFLHNRGHSSSAMRRGSSNEMPEGAKPQGLRRLTGLRSASPGPEGGPSSWRMKGDLGAQRWRQIKQGLKLIGQKRKEQNRIDQIKSGELMAELLAGSPAALILANYFLRDEREKKKVPILLEQLKVSITDSKEKEDMSGDRHDVFRIDLEYGSGTMRMQWTIWRSLTDFANLHLKCKLQSGTERYLQRRVTEDMSRAKLPRFPKTALPYLRGVRGLTEEDYEDEDNVDEADRGQLPSGDLDAAPDRQSSGNANGPATTRPAKDKRRASTFGALSRRSTGGEASLSAQGTPNSPGNLQGAARRDTYHERQRKKLENYLRDLIRYLFFRPGSNRLCSFLELSALGVRLAGEDGYHGKEGMLVLMGSKGVDFRKATKPHMMIERHRPMWFLVRHSYIVCVDSPETMNIYDVFLVDSDFSLQGRRPRLRDQKGAKDIAKTAKETAAHPRHHFLRLKNAERELRLLARNDRQLLQFEESIQHMQSLTIWSQKHRFESFAPVRKNVFAQWFVDGRDYMWNLSKAISMARDVIYIHDWWVSPELYLRRPPATSQRWRLDRLLKQKAEEGVKIFVMVYRNINQTIPIDSEWTKFSLLDLHPNIYVQRSPNQVRQNVFFWAHHEKFCVIDDVIAFQGGIDLCYGRWDTPQHALIDDKPTGFDDFGAKDTDSCQTWVGKDYSNGRAGDFYSLDQPYEVMYDRNKVPRGPWHDVGSELVGQPARDLCRHFVQRWNYILRQRKPSRPTPFLLPPADFVPKELKDLGLQGTCNVQMLRSAAEWSLGTPNKVETSIMNAYCKLIQTSDHFIYIENQFFVTTCTVDGTRIENRIGDALVERIIRAHQKGEDWAAVIVIPLMPGFDNSIDSPEGTALRLIMQCQYRSICRGSTSIFERLVAHGINPEDYIRFYSLRAWGMIGPNKALVTEQLYVHAKVMIVDDRYAIIGSANINERSMLGTRDSEQAAIIQDTDMIDSVMAGEKYKVGRFAHTLRMRLMREHLGLDVDHISDEERASQQAREKGSEGSSNASTVVSHQQDGSGRPRSRAQEEVLMKLETMHSFNHDVDWEQEKNPYLRSNKKVTSDQRVMGNAAHREDVEGFGVDNMIAQEKVMMLRGRDSVITQADQEILLTSEASGGRGTLLHPVKSAKEPPVESSPPSSREEDNTLTTAILPPPHLLRLHTSELGLPQLSQLPPLPVEDDTSIGGPPLQRNFTQGSSDSLAPLLGSMRRPIVDKDCMRDPVNDSFFHDTWHAVAENNTKIFRQVFRCMPDDEVSSWKDFEAFIAYEERFAQSQGLGKSTARQQQDTKAQTGPPGHKTSPNAERADMVKEKLKDFANHGEESNRGSEKQTRDRGISDATKDSRNNQSITNGSSAHHEGFPPVAESDLLNEKAAAQQYKAAHGQIEFGDLPAKERSPSVENGVDIDAEKLSPDQSEQASSQPRRRRRATTRSTAALRANDALLSKAEAEGLMKLVQGHLVLFPYNWLEKEERGGKWLYSLDQMQPLEVYD